MLIDYNIDGAGILSPPCSYYAHTMVGSQRCLACRHFVQDFFSARKIYCGADNYLEDIKSFLQLICLPVSNRDQYHVERSTMIKLIDILHNDYSFYDDTLERFLLKSCKDSPSGDTINAN